MEQNKNLKLKGRVIHGLHLGKEFGVATANLELLDKKKKTKEGVYFVHVKIEDESENKRGLLHIGEKKTLNKGFSIELHVLDFDGDLYGKIIEVDILKRRRNIIKFETLEDLFIQIRKDIVWARKYFLRNIIFDVWENINDFQRFQMGSKTVGLLGHNKNFKKANHVFLFAPTRNEINFVHILCSRFKEKRYFFPKVSKKNMNFYASDFEHLRPGKFGILEPEGGRPIIPKKNDLVIVPAVAVDKNNNRLGKGGGYFDRYLKENRAHKMCVVPDFACVKKVPVEPHDIPVDEILTIPSNV